MAANLGQQKQENEMFVYSVSHDLRSPLVNLQGFSEELSLSCRDLRDLFGRDDVPEPVRRRGMQLMDRDIEESIRFIQAAVGRLARIIDALLRLSRAGRVEYQWQQVNLSTTVGKIVDALHDTITAKGAEVAVGELPPAWGDPTALEQVFANLIGNAVQYLDPDRTGRIEVDGGGPKATGCRRACGSTASATTAWASPRRTTSDVHGLQPAAPRRRPGRGDRAGPGPPDGRAARRADLAGVGAGVGTTFYVALPAAPARGAPGLGGGPPPATPPPPAAPAYP